MASKSTKGSKTTKAQTVEKMLRRPSGATLAQLQKATGWQPHSVRAAMSGLRKRGVAVTRTREGTAPSVYRIGDA